MCKIDSGTIISDVDNFRNLAPYLNINSEYLQNSLKTNTFSVTHTHVWHVWGIFPFDLQAGESISH